MALSSMMKIKANEIPNAVEKLAPQLRDTLMKYVYKGFENPKDYSCNLLLTWHEKVSRKNETNRILLHLMNLYFSLFLYLRLWRWQDWVRLSVC